MRFMFINVLNISIDIDLKITNIIVKMLVSKLSMLL